MFDLVFLEVVLVLGFLALWVLAMGVWVIKTKLEIANESKDFEISCLRYEKEFLEDRLELNRLERKQAKEQDNDGTNEN